MRPRRKDRHLPPCVYRRHGAFWYVKKGKWTRLGVELRASLEAYAALQNAPAGELPDLIDKVLAHVGPKLSPATRKSYEVAAGKLKRIFVEFSPAQVKPKDVAGMKVALAGTPNMANRCLTVLRIVFNHAVEWQLVDSNPCASVRRFDEAKRTRYLTDAELDAIRAAAGPRLRVIVDLAYLTAQRIGDVLMIRRADLAADGIQFRQGKTDVALTVAWTPDLEAAVAAAKALHRNVVAMTLLHNRRGKPPDYSTVKIQWNKACAAAGVKDARLHDLRAKALTDAKRQGQDATALAGHSNAEMTKRYIRLRESPLVHGPRRSA